MVLIMVYMWLKGFKSKLHSSYQEKNLEDQRPCSSYVTDTPRTELI